MRKVFCYDFSKFKCIQYLIQVRTFRWNFPRYIYYKLGYLLDCLKTCLRGTTGGGGLIYRQTLNELFIRKDIVFRICEYNFLVRYYVETYMYFRYVDACICVCVYVYTRWVNSTRSLRDWCTVNQMHRRDGPMVHRPTNCQLSVVADQRLSTGVNGI